MSVFASRIPMTYTAHHTKWNCKYHIVFAPNIEERQFYESRRLDVGRMLRKVVGKNGNMCKYNRSRSSRDHVHINSRNTTQNECFWFCRIFKRKKSSQMIFERWANARRHEIDHFGRGFM